VALDVRGEPLALLPAQPLMWLRVDAAEARGSQHWSALAPLVERAAGDSLQVLERELGFNLLADAELFAFGLYARPGNTPTGAPPWPMLYVRGSLDREAILAAARARAAADDPLTERREAGLHFHATRSRAYLFAAPDVLILFDPALTGRLARQLAGEAAGSASVDARFDPLWTEAGGRGGTVQLAADAAALRAQRVAAEAEEPLARSLEQGVLRLDAADEVRAGVVALAASEETAQRLVGSIEESRQTFARNFAVRMLDLRRLLQQGITAVHEGRQVRVRVEARAEEVSRALRAAELLQRMTTE
jgi:hypothetical protein